MSRSIGVLRRSALLKAVPILAEAGQAGAHLKSFLIGKSVDSRKEVPASSPGVSGTSPDVRDFVADARHPPTEIENCFSYDEVGCGRILEAFRLNGVACEAVRIGDAQSIAPFNSEFSPDGKWLAYTLRSVTSANVYVEPFPPTGAKYQITTENGHHPVWLPDGTGLSYRVSDSQQMVVRVNTTPSFSVGNPAQDPALLPSVESFLGRSYDLTRDGSRFLALSADLNASETRLAGLGDLQQEIRIVQNWLEELKERVPVD